MEYVWEVIEMWDHSTDGNELQWFMSGGEESSSAPIGLVRVLPSNGSLGFQEIWCSLALGVHQQWASECGLSIFSNASSLSGMVWQFSGFSYASLTAFLALCCQINPSSLKFSRVGIGINYQWFSFGIGKCSWKF